jgi:hypothetical protein
MGFWSFLKGEGSANKSNNHELNEHLNNAKTNLKSGSEFIAKFFEGVRDFQPAHRHADLYNLQVRGKLNDIRRDIRNGILFIDEKMENRVNTMNVIRSPEHLRDLLNLWIAAIKHDDEKTEDILKILEIEMWSDERAKRSFPIPKNKILVCGYLITAMNYLKQARDNLNNYLDANLINSS